MALPTDAMDALMTLTALTYDDLAEIADILTRLFSAEGQVLDLNQQRGAAQGEGATEGIIGTGWPLQLHSACSPSCAVPSSNDWQPGSCPATQRSSPTPVTA